MQAHVIVIDSRALYRVGIVHLLASDARIATVVSAVSLDDVFTFAPESSPTVVLLEWSLVRGHWDSVLRLRQLHPAAKILLFDIPEHDIVLVHAIRSGVHGLIDEHSGIEFVLQAVLTLAAGGTIVAPRLAQHVVGWQYVLNENAQDYRSAASLDLTERECSVLSAVASGLTNRQAANLLGISEHTVRAHLRSLSRKLGVQNRVEATSKAIQIGLLTGTRRGELDSA